MGLWGQGPQPLPPLVPPPSWPLRWKRGQWSSQPSMDTEHLMYTHPGGFDPPGSRHWHLLLAQCWPGTGRPTGDTQPRALPPPRAPCQAFPSRVPASPRPRVPRRIQRLRLSLLSFGRAMAALGAFSYCKAARAHRGAKQMGEAPVTHGFTTHGRDSPCHRGPAWHCGTVCSSHRAPSEPPLQTPSPWPLCGHVQGPRHDALSLASTHPCVALSLRK